jgi:hypothetical protein
VTSRIFDGVSVVAGTAKANDATLGTQFSLSSQQGLYGIWFYSVPTALAFPSAVVIWKTDGTKLAGTENLSPTWIGALGSGWIRCAFDGSVPLQASTTYVVSVYHDASALWRTNTGNFWTSGIGSAGLTSGPITAPNNAGSLHGQGITSVGYTYPTTSGAGQNFWADVEVGTLVLPVPGSASTGHVSQAVTVAQTSPAITASSSSHTSLQTSRSSGSVATTHSQVGGVET